MHGGVERGQVSRQHRGAQQEGHLFRRAAAGVSVLISMVDMRLAYLLTTSRTTGLDAIAALDDVCFERDGPWAAMQLQEEATGVA